jgi:hypothetical protein
MSKPIAPDRFGWEEIIGTLALLALAVVGYLGVVDYVMPVKWPKITITAPSAPRVERPSFLGCCTASGVTTTGAAVAYCFSTDTKTCVWGAR